MVAQPASGPTASTRPPDPSPPPYPPNAEPDLRSRGGVRRMISSVTRLAAIQARLILLQAKLTAKRIMVAAALWAAAIVVGILAVIFLYIAIYRILVDVVGLAPAWTMLIYALVHVGIAVGLAFWALSIFKKPLPGKA